MHNTVKAGSGAAITWMIGIVVIALLVATLRDATPVAAQDPPTASSTPPAYEYDVLPGIQLGFDVGPSSTYTPHDLRMSCGWHHVCEPGRYGVDKSKDGLDMRVFVAGNDVQENTAERPVYATLRAVVHADTTPSFTAEVIDVSEPNTSGCRYVEIEVFDSATNPVARLRYVHVIPSVVKGNAINLPDTGSGLTALAFSRVGTVAWHPGKTGVDEALKDGPSCDTSGPHLHVDDGSPSFDLEPRNRNVGDSTRGFPDAVNARQFCSDTWLFKIESRAVSSPASTVASCPTIATPTGLYAAPGDALLALTWNEVKPAADAGYTITGYEFRYKAATASDWPETWAPVSGTSHLLTDLTNGTGYDVELRAVSDRFLRSAAVADSGTPQAGLVPTTCTVDVAVRDAGGNALSVDGVGVTGGGTAACGSRQLEVELTDPNYQFTSWTVAPAPGLTIDCEPTSTSCKLTFGTAEGDATTADVTATFTRKQCTVTGNALPVDIGGAVIGRQTGGSVDANSSGQASVGVPCGDDVTLTPTANTDYTFTGWSGCTSVSRTTCTVTTSGLSQSAFVTATFTALTATAGDGEIELSWRAVTGAREYGVRTSTDGGTNWGSWQGGIAATATAHTLTGLANGTTYTAQMRVRSASGWSLPSGAVTATPRVKHELEATAGEGGSVICTVGVTSVDCDRAFLEGTVVTLKALAAPTYLFTRWEFEEGSGCDSSEVTGHGTMATCDVEMSEEVEVAAVFTRTYMLNVSDPETGGSAACKLAGTADSCPSRVRSGTMVSITATPSDDSYEFVHWTVTTEGGEGAQGAADESTEEPPTNNPLEITVTADTTVTPVFRVKVVDTAPTFATETFTASFAVGVQKSVQLPEATGGNGALTYSLDPVPAGLEFDSATAVLARKATTTGTMVAGTTTAELKVQDADDNRADRDTDTVTVTVTVSPPDTAPAFAATTFTAPFTVNVAGSVSLPRASGGDGTLSYTPSHRSRRGSR